LPMQDQHAASVKTTEAYKFIKFDSQEMINYV
jgi:hypothetical protein